MHGAPQGKMGEKVSDLAQRHLLADIPVPIPRQLALLEAMGILGLQPPLSLALPRPLLADVLPPHALRTL